MEVSTLDSYRAERKAEELNCSTFGHALFPGKLTQSRGILLRSATLQIRYEIRHVFHIINSFQYMIPKDLQIPTVEEEIRRYSSQYSVRLST
jgi:hypothetical protein